MFFGDCGPAGRAGAGRGFGWRMDPNLGAFFWGGSRRGPWRGGRMFEQGDLKFVILQLLNEKPRHGYEIIKELEERSGGRYTPSPGTVYPTLTLLEDTGHARSAVEEGGRKVYSITDEGKRYLEEHRSVVDEVLERLAQVGESIFGEQLRPAHEAMAALGRAYLRATVHRSPTAEEVQQIVAIARRAADELEAIAAKH